jgi:hypothetical protein
MIPSQELPGQPGTACRLLMCVPYSYSSKESKTSKSYIYSLSDTSRALVFLVVRPRVHPLRHVVLVVVAVRRHHGFPFRTRS